MIETQLSFSAPITLNNSVGLGLATKKETLSNNSDTLTTCLQQQSYLPSEPVLPRTVSFTEDSSEITIIGMLIERISMLDTIISKLDNSVKKQLEDIVEKTNQASLTSFGSKKNLKIQEDRLKKWETINLAVAIPLAIASIWLHPISLPEIRALEARTLETLVSVALQVFSLGVYSQKNLQKRELFQLKAEGILFKDRMKRAEDRQESLHKKHKDSTSNLLENMFLMGNNV